MGRGTIYPISSPVFNHIKCTWFNSLINCRLLEGGFVHKVNVIYYWRVKGQPVPCRIFFSSGYQDTKEIFIPSSQLYNQKSESNIKWEIVAVIARCLTI